MTVFSRFVLLVGCIFWFFPFVPATRKSETPRVLDKRARWGMAIEALAFALLWIPIFPRKPPAAWEVLSAAVLLVLASVLSWSSTRAMGRLWRLDAGLGENHALVRRGPYRVIRHPVYTSMLCVALAMGLVVSSLSVLAASLAIFMIGTEIRVRAEDRLLAAHFGEQYSAYRNAVPAYLPFLR